MATDYNYRHLDTLPEYAAPTWQLDPLKVMNPDVIKWGGKVPPPAIGTDIIATINRLGRATVIGYFVEHNWLGLLVKLHNPPEWHRKQNGLNPGPSHIFGTEMEPVS